jgi:hypothetical protein
MASAATASADEIADCEARLVGDAKRFDTGISSVRFDRADIRFDKYAAKVGSQFVSSVIYGPADIQGKGGPQRLTVICLHGGTGIGPVFAYTLP